MESTRDERLGVLPGEDRLVRDVMSREVVTISPSHSLKDAARLIRDRQVPALVVTEGARLVGILTVYDMVIHGMTRDAAPHTIPVRQVIGDRVPIACGDHAILAEAADLMAEHRLQSLPVVNADGALVGQLSLLDIAGAVMPNAAAAWLTRIRKESDRQHPTAPQ
jgi:CBS domain-containing protein